MTEFEAVPQEENGEETRQPPDAPQEESGEAAQETARLTARIAELEASLAEAQRAAARSEAQRRCEKCLGERSLDGALAPFVLAACGEDMSDAALGERADALGAAVEAAARRLLGERTPHPPAAGEAASLTGKMIRELPLAQLAEMMR